jgi:hypothetical protein
MPSLLEIEPNLETATVLEEARKRLAKNFGVTLQGNRLTLRFTHNDELVDISTIIDEVTTPSENKESQRRSAEYRKLIEKYPELAEELHYAETGEWPQ